MGLEPPQLERMREGKCPPWFTRKKPDDDIIDLTNSDDEKTVSTGKTSDNVQDTVALKRLMKEFKAVSESDSVKNGIFSVSLIGDCLFKWEVQLKKFYEGSRLAKDLITLKEQQGYDYVLLNIIFPKAYPFDPPFVHVVKPIINNGFVVSGGAICMELLTPGGWSSCYLVESLILQIAATLVEGEADIVFNGNLSNYSLRKARASFKMLDILHRSNGWASVLYWQNGSVIKFWRQIFGDADSMDDKFVDVVVFECELLHPATTNGQGPVFWFPFEPIKSGAR
ncbi:Ubiquitin-conjugating enzyme E2 [Trichinella spiralis]|uniref:Ubiquitin-conjugating enzyme E2 n=1 Tax=Trichinella spiralis TaxID=6334 RepID=A0ABR3KZD2_TRISP